MRVYVAGPLTKGDWFQNVRRAIDTAEEITRLTGFQCFVPHLSLTWEMIHHHDYEWWMAWCLEWVGACDILFRRPGESSGGDREVAHALELGIPVFETLEAMVNRFMAHEERFPVGVDAIQCLNDNSGKMTIEDGVYVVRWREG